MDHETAMATVAPASPGLLERIRSGDREAAERMAEEHYRRLYAFLYRFTGDPDRAADLTQETFRKAWQSLGGFDGRSSISTWLHRIAYTTFLNSVRGPRRLEPLEAAPPQPDPSPAADESIEKLQEEQAVRRAVLALPDDLRFTVTAHYWGEMSVSEIAAVEHITTVAVRKRLAKAMTRLESLLQEVNS